MNISIGYEIVHVPKVILIARWVCLQGLELSYQIGLALGFCNITNDANIHVCGNGARFRVMRSARDTRYEYQQVVMELGMNTRYGYDFNALGFCAKFCTHVAQLCGYFNDQNLFVVALDCGYFIQLANMCFYSVWHVQIVDYYTLCFIFFNSFHGVPCPFSLNYNFSVHNSLCALCFPIANDAYVITHLLVL